MSARFLISILSMRVESGIQQCLNSVRLGGGHFRLHLTSNGSHEVAHLFEAHSVSFPGRVVRHEANPVNLGFIEPNNRAMRFAQESGYDYLVTLNDDATVPPGWLDMIAAEFERHPAAAIVGARGGCRTLGTDFNGTNGPTLDYVEGSCCAYRVAVWSKHFRSLYPDWLEFAYAEDASTALEVQRLGYTIHEAAFEIEHARGSTSRHVAKVRECQARNHAKAKVRFAHWLRHRTFAHRIVVRRWDATGDVLLTTPIIDALWRANPLCGIHVETVFPELFTRNPHVASAARTVGRQPTDLLIDLDGTYEATPMRHIVRSYAQAAGVVLHEKFATQYSVAPADAEWAHDQLGGPGANYGGPIVAVHAGPSTWPGKNWPEERWISVVDHLIYLGYMVVLVGGQTNPGLTRPTPSVLDLTGRTTIPQLFAVLKLCDLLISIDSFPLHAAQAVGTPVVGLFGVTTPELICTDGSRWVAARSDKFHPDTGLRHRVAGTTMVQTDDACMRTITVAQVLDAIAQLRAPAPIPIPS